jgi:hypothetical protein
VGLSCGNPTSLSMTVSRLTTYRHESLWRPKIAVENVAAIDVRSGDGSRGVDAVAGGSLADQRACALTFEGGYGSAGGAHEAVAPTGNFPDVVLCSLW